MVLGVKKYLLLQQFWCQITRRLDFLPLGTQEVKLDENMS